jgi:hypothetical protein
MQSFDVPDRVYVLKYREREYFGIGSKSRHRSSVFIFKQRKNVEAVRRKICTMQSIDIEHSTRRPYEFLLRPHMYTVPEDSVLHPPPILYNKLIVQHENTTDLLNRICISGMCLCMIDDVQALSSGDLRMFCGYTMEPELEGADMSMFLEKMYTMPLF